MEDGTIMLILIVVAIIAIVNGLIGAIVGHAKHGPGFWWGFFLGPVGWILAALLPPIYVVCQQGDSDWRMAGPKSLYERTVMNRNGAGNMGGKAAGTMECPYCGQPIATSSLHPGFNVCPHCGEKIEVES